MAVLDQGVGMSDCEACNILISSVVKNLYEARKLSTWCREDARACVLCLNRTVGALDRGWLSSNGEEDESDYKKNNKKYDNIDRR